MNKLDLQKRLKQLAVKTGWLCMKLPSACINRVYTGQIIRSSSSSASNYRAACRGKSKADFIHKLKIVEEELDETMFFYEMFAEFNPDIKNELRQLYQEADELLSIMVGSINTAKRNRVDKKSEIQSNLQFTI